MPESNAQPVRPPRERWLGAVCIGVIGLLWLMLGWHRLIDADFWWQISLGRRIWHEGFIRGDTFTFTRPGAPTWSVSWGYFVAAWGLFEALGPPAILGAKLAVIGATFLLVWRFCLTRAGLLAAALLTFACGLACSQRFAARPEVGAYLLLACFLTLLLRSREGKQRGLWALPLLQVAWTNVHSTFVLGPLLVLALVIERIWRRLAARFMDAPASESAAPLGVLALCGLATLASPFATDVWGVPYRRLLAFLPDPALRPLVLLAPGIGIGALGVMFWLAPRAGRWWRARGTGTELHRVQRRRLAPIGLTLGCIGALALGIWLFRSGTPDMERATVTELAPTWTYGAAYAAVRVYYALALASVVVGALGVRRLGVFWVLTLPALGVLSLLAIRALPFFAIPAAMFIAEMLGPMPRRGTTGDPAGAGLASRGAILGVLLASIVQIHALATDRFHVRQGDLRQFGSGICRDAFPEKIADFLLPLRTRLRPFTSDVAGSYLIWRGFQVFGDTRGTGGIISEYRRIFAEPGAIEDPIAAYRINALIVDTTNPGLMQYVARRPFWRLVFLDQVGAVFLPAGEFLEVPTLDLASGTESWSRRLMAVFSLPRRRDSVGLFERVDSPIPCARLGRSLYALGQPTLASNLLESSLAADPNSFPAWRELAYCRENLGNLAGADEAYRRAIQQSPSDPTLRVRRGYVLLHRGNTLQALDLANETLRSHPNFADAVSLVSACKQQMNDAESRRLLRDK